MVARTERARARSKERAFGLDALAFEGLRACDFLESPMLLNTILDMIIYSSKSN